MTVRTLKQLVVPERVVAVAPVGATPGWARQLERNLFRGGFAGERLTLGTVGEAPAEAVLAGPEALDGRPFLALIALPQPEPVLLLERLQACGCRVAILIGGGIGPLTLSPTVREALGQRAQALGVRLLGPTRIGVLLPRLGLSAGAATSLPARGNLALVTQSDALAAATLDWAAARGIGFSVVASLGDSADVELGDLLDLLALDLETRAVLIQLEGVRDARRFVSAARAAARAKPVVVLRAGRHAVPGEAGALRDAAHEAAFRRAGMLRVRSVEELFATAGTLASWAGARRTRLHSGRLAIVANGRGPALLAADLLVDLGGELAPLAPATLSALALALGPVPGLGNPLDLGLDAGPDALAAALPPLLADPGCDAVLVLLAPGTGEPPERFAEALLGLRERAREAQRLLLVAWLGEATVASARHLTAEGRVPTYATPEEAVRALQDLVAFERQQRLLQEIPRSERVEDRPRCGPVAAIVRHAVAEGRRHLLGGEVARLLDAYALPPLAEVPDVLGGFEMLACVRTDPTFGPVIRFGQGVPGLAPVGEVAAALPPLSPRLARAMLQETGLGRLILAGDNPRLPDPEAVACVLVRLAQLVVDRAEIVAVDLEFAFTGEAGLRTVLANVEVAPWPAGADPASRLAVRPYPAELERRMTLEDGRQVLLRPIRPEDAGAVARTFGRLSADDARFRLFAPLRELPIELVARLTQIDYDREMALVAEDPASPGELLGGARVSMEPDGRRAEFAVTVRTDGQGHGLGRCTLEAVLDYARQRGVEEVWGTILADNHRMLGLAKALGFTLRRDPDEPDAVLAVKRLDGTA